MFSRRSCLAFASLMILGLALPSLTEAAKGKNNNPGKIEGTLVAVASNGVVIAKSNGTQVSLGVTANTKVELNERRVPVTSLPVGSRAEALFDPVTLIATKVEVNN